VHLNVLGWAGLTVLATVVVFGPALLRARMSPGADDRAAAALRAASCALLVAVPAVVLAGGGEGWPATFGRGLAVAALAVYGAAVLVVVAGVLRATVTAKPSPVRWSVAAATIWFPLGVAIDVVAVAAAERRAFEVVGVVLFVGVLTQLILAVLLHLVPQLRGRGTASRDALLRRTGKGAPLRTFLLNLGVLVVAVAIGADLTLGADTAWPVRLGWITVALGVGAHLLPAVWPVGRSAPVPRAVP
jgi:nitrite reductase (NO-forming)